MTPQEQQLIAGLIDRVQKTQLPEKDLEAEQMLHQGLGANPDALYILSQTVIVQQYALEQAQRQLAEARRQQQQPKHATSFLGGLFGRDEAAPPPPPAYQPVPSYAPGSAPAPATGYPPQAGFGGSPAPQGGGFLRSALQTATGVAAGALAFQGIESLMHGFGGSGGGAQGFGGFGNDRPEEVTNNYYGDSDRDTGSGLSSDIEDRRGDAAFGASDDSAADLADTSSDDDSSFTNNDDSLDDGGGDTGSFNDTGGGDDSSFS